MRILVGFIVFFTVMILIGIFSKITKKANPTVLEKGYNSICLLSKYILGSTLNISGGPIQLKNRVLVISNHPTVLDVIYLVLWAKEKNRLGDLFFVCKSSLSQMPIIGNLIKQTQCLVSKNFEEDRDNIIDFCKKLSSQKSYILIIFPEGTTLFPETQLKSQLFAQKNNKVVFENVLYPRHKGLELIIKNLIIEQIVDLTLLYEDDPRITDDRELLLDCYPRKATIIEKEVILKEITIENLETFLEKTWVVKDKFMKKLSERKL